MRVPLTKVERAILFYHRSLKAFQEMTLPHIALKPFIVRSLYMFEGTILFTHNSLDVCSETIIMSEWRIEKNSMFARHSAVIQIGIYKQIAIHS